MRAAWLGALLALSGCDVLFPIDPFAEPPDAPVDGERGDAVVDGFVGPDAVIGLDGTDAVDPCAQAPLLCLPFDDLAEIPAGGPGMTSDATGNHHDATVSGLVPIERLPSHAPAAKFTEFSSCSVPSDGLGNLQTFTVAAWIMYEEQSNIVVPVASRGETFSLTLVQTEVGRNLACNAGLVLGGPSVPVAPGEWVFAVCSFNGSEVHLYTQSDDLSGPGGKVDSPDPLLIGGDNQGGFLHGAIDDVRLWKSALDDVDAMRLVNASVGSR